MVFYRILHLFWLKDFTFEMINIMIFCWRIINEPFNFLGFICGWYLIMISETVTQLKISLKYKWRPLQRTKRVRWKTARWHWLSVFPAQCCLLNRQVNDWKDRIPKQPQFLSPYMVNQLAWSNEDTNFYTKFHNICTHYCEAWAWKNVDYKLLNIFNVLSNILKWKTIVFK